LASSDTALASLAMLQANWDARRQDYIGLFVPFVVVCLPASTTKPIVWPDLIESVQQRFGMKIPSNTIRTIMNRAKDQCLVKVENGVWYCVDEGRTLQRLDSSRSQALRRQASLVDRLCRFCREHHDTDWGENVSVQVGVGQDRGRIRYSRGDE